MRIVTKYIIDIFPGMYLWYLEANTIAHKILWGLIWDTLLPSLRLFLERSYVVFCKRQTPGDERWGAMWRLSVSASGWVRDLGRRALIDSLTHSCSS
jgi:hypothetical protein